MTDASLVQKAADDWTHELASWTTGANGQRGCGSQKLTLSRSSTYREEENDSGDGSDRIERICGYS